MSAEQAKRDANRIPVGLAVTDDASLDPTQLRVDPSTNRLKVNSTLTGDVSVDSSSTPYALKLTVSGAITYVGEAAVGSAQASAVWRIKRIDETTGIVITWKDGDSLFDNSATDLTTGPFS